MSAPAPFPSLEAMGDVVRSGTVSQDHWLREAIARIRSSDAGDRPLRAFLSVADPAVSRALPAPHGIDADPDGPLLGVPVGVKDNLATLDLPTTCASRILQGYVSPFEATVIRKLRAAGGWVAGKTNMDEFAMGSSTENSAIGPTRNPLDRGRVPGGSSGGSAAAVAAGIVPVALGSDTGGSVRQPAAFCGVVGLKPTYGRVSRYGLVAFASSLDQVGTFGRTVHEAARLLEVVAGHDPLDSTSARRPVPRFSAAIPGGVAGMVVGVPAEYIPESLDPALRRQCNRVLEMLSSGGAEIRRVSLPHTAWAIPTYYVLATAEASSNLARFDGVRYGMRAPGAASTHEVYEATRSAGFGTEVKRRIMLGTYALSAGYYEAYYGRAQKVRSLIARDFREVFASGVDVLFTATAPTPAFALGEKTGDPYTMYLSDIFTVTANLAGIPAISIPVGEVDGLPVGGQFMAPHWEEERMIRVAGTVEAALAGRES